MRAVLGLGILDAQAISDVRYFLRNCEGQYSDQRIGELETGTLRAYRWQYIVSGARHPRFVELLGGMITAEQGQRVGAALAPLMG